MSTKWLGIYSGFFVAMLLLALFVSGVFQQAILPRISGARARGALEVNEGEGAPRPQEAAKETRAADSTAAPAAPTGAEPPATGRVAQPQTPGPSPASAKDATADKAAQIKRLARVYEGMRPKEAASVIEKLDRALAARVLWEMRERQAAKILGAMNAGAAAELSHLLGQVPAGGAS